MFPYTGSKKNEIKNFIDYVPDNIENYTIVEPFGGSGAFSYYLMNQYDKINIHLNDLDKNTFNMYKMIVDNKIDEFVDTISLILNTLPEPESAKQVEMIMNVLKKIDTVETNYIVRIIQYRPKSKTIRTGMIEKLKKQIVNKNMTIQKLTIPENTKIKLSNDDYKKVLELYKDDQNAFIFLDPPYLSDRNNINDIYDILSFSDEDFLYIRDYLKTAKCKIMIVVLNSVFMRFAFENHIKYKYDKIYQLCKKKVEHLVITNY